MEVLQGGQIFGSPVASVARGVRVSGTGHTSSWVVSLLVV